MPETGPNLLYFKAIQKPPLMPRTSKLLHDPTFVQQSAVNSFSN